MLEVPLAALHCLTSARYLYWTHHLSPSFSALSVRTTMDNGPVPNIDMDVPPEDRCLICMDLLYDPVTFPCDCNYQICATRLFESDDHPSGWTCGWASRNAKIVESLSARLNSSYLERKCAWCSRKFWTVSRLDRGLQAKYPELYLQRGKEATKLWSKRMNTELNVLHYVRQVSHTIPEFI